MSFKILGTGRAVPSNKVTNDDLAEYIETSDEWISQRTGIRSRYISTGETNTELATEAAKKAIEMAGISPEEIDLIIAGTVSGDCIYPTLACLVQANVGAKNAIAFDLSAGCTGFLYSLQVADGFMAAGTVKKALIIGAEILSKMMDWNDRTTCVLFGDGAGAAVIEASSDPADKVSFISGADGEGGMALYCKNRPLNNHYVTNDTALDYTHMNGQDVFKFAVKTVPAALSEAIEKHGIAVEDIDMFLLHQANLRIIESVAKRLHSPLEKFPTIVEEYGNVSAASVPILLDVQVREGKLKRGDKIALAGFGAGLTWSAAVMTF